MRKGPLKLYILIVRTIEGPSVWSFWCSSCINSNRRHSGVSCRICCDSYWWSPNLRTVMVFSFEKFPSKTLSSIPPPLAALPFFPHIPTVSLPPSLTYCTPLLCFRSFFFLSLFPFFSLVYALLLVTLSPGLGGSDWVVSGSFGNRKMELPFL